MDNNLGGVARAIMAAISEAGGIMASPAEWDAIPEDFKAGILSDMATAAIETVRAAPFADIAEEMRKEFILASNECRDTVSAGNLSVLLARMSRRIFDYSLSDITADGMRACDLVKIEVTVRLASVITDEPMLGGIGVACNKFLPPKQE